MGGGVSLAGPYCYLREAKLGWKEAPWVPAPISVTGRSCTDLCHWWLQVTSCEVGMRLEQGRGGAERR